MMTEIMILSAIVLVLVLGALALIHASGSD